MRVGVNQGYSLNLLTRVVSKCQKLDNGHLQNV